MALFNIKTREPRRFNHKFMYVNERKEKLKKIEERAKRDLGIIPEENVKCYLRYQYKLL